jgi:hypothetical protein
MTPLELVREVASTFSKQLTDKMCEAILYMETTFPMKRIVSEDPLKIEDDFRNQLLEFFYSGKEPGYRQDKEIAELRAQGKWP